MVCALCKKDAELRGSHIIPEFLYGPAYDEKHRIALVEAGNRKRRLLQKGIRELLLCGGCERYLNTAYEQPISRAWPTMIPPEVPGESYLLEGVEFAVFKLFHLSILWRASVARGESWSEVSLGAVHEERLRAALLECNAPPKDRYPLLGNVFLEPQTRRPCFGCVMPPTANRIGAARVYSFLYGGCSWHTVVSSHTAVDSESPFVLSEAGQMGMVVYDLTRLRDFDLGAHVNFRWKKPDY